MADFCVLLKLPTCVGSSIVSQWLSAQACSQLDIACCTNLARSRYLELLSKAEAVDFAIKSYSDQYFGRMCWMVSRKLKGRTLKFGLRSLSEVEQQTMTAYIQMSASCLKTVIIHSDDLAITTALLRSLATNSALFITKLNVLTFSELWADDQNEWRVSMQTIIRNTAVSLVHLYTSGTVLHMLGCVGLPALESIQVRGCNDAQLQYVCSVAPLLRRIKLEESRCTGAGLAVIAQHCSKLQSFECSNCGHPSSVAVDEGLAIIAKRCSNLARLSIEGGCIITDVGMHAIATQCALLADFSLCLNKHVTDTPLIALACSANARTLQTVELQRCIAITGTCVVALAKHCTALRSLSVSIRGDFLPHLKLAIPHLRGVRKLDISCMPVDDEVLQLIAEHMVELVELDIGRDVGDAAVYTAVGLSALAVKCEKLRLLNLCPSRHDEHELVETLCKQLRPGLEISYDC